MYHSNSHLIEPPLAPPEMSTVVNRLQKSALFRDYQAAFQKLSGLPVTLRAAGSFQSPLSGSGRLNPFCAMMATRSATCAACLMFQQQIEHKSIDRPKSLECPAGLTESAVPIRVGTRTFAYLQTGQVLLRPPSRARFAKLTAQLLRGNSGLALAQLKAAYFKSPVMTAAQYDSLLRLLVIFGHHLSTISNQIMLQGAVAEPVAVSRARQFIAEHCSEVVSLNQVAQVVHMSSFYFCKVFRKATGLTFTAYLARSRVESVKDLLLNPQIRISEAAYAAGFQSLSQFNRVFQRITGESPSVFRDRLVAPAPAPASRRTSFSAARRTAA